MKGLTIAKEVKRVVSLICLITMIAIIPSANTAFASDTNNSTLYVNINKIGDADSILLEQNGDFILVDTGLSSDSSTVINTLDSRRAAKLQGLIITSYDNDSMGGLSKIASHLNYNIDYVYGRFYNTAELTVLKKYSIDTYNNYIKFVNVVMNISNTISDTTYTELPAAASVDTVYSQSLYIFGDGMGIWHSPSKSLTNVNLGNTKIQFRNRKGSNLNYVTSKEDFASRLVNDSLVFVVLTPSGKYLMFMGDLNTEGINDILTDKYTYSIYCDVLILPHHGYANNINQKLLDSSSLEYSIVTCETEKGTSELTKDYESETGEKIEGTATRLSGLTKNYSNFGTLLYTGRSDNAFGCLSVSSNGEIKIKDLNEYTVK